jgi:hypothetical protein
MLLSVLDDGTVIQPTSGRLFFAAEKPAVRRGSVSSAEGRGCSARQREVNKGVVVMKRAIPPAPERAAIADLNRLLADDDDPRDAMARVSAEIVAYQAKGLEVPTDLMRLSKALAAECVAQSQGR